MVLGISLKPPSITAVYLRWIDGLLFYQATLNPVLLIVRKKHPKMKGILFEKHTQGWCQFQQLLLVKDWGAQAFHFFNLERQTVAGERVLVPGYIRRM